MGIWIPQPGRARLPVVPNRAATHNRLEPPRLAERAPGCPILLFASFAKKRVGALTSLIETQNSAMAYSITKRATVLSVRKCKFCGNPADSREHVIADWILQKINIQDEIRRVVGKSAPVSFRQLQSRELRAFAPRATTVG